MVYNTFERGCILRSVIVAFGERSLVMVVDHDEDFVLSALSGLDVTFEELPSLEIEGVSIRAMETPEVIFVNRGEKTSDYR